MAAPCTLVSAPISCGPRAGRHRAALGASAKDSGDEEIFGVRVKTHAAWGLIFSLPASGRDQSV